MAVQRWGPFAEFERLDETLNRMSRSLGRDLWAGSESEVAWAVPLDVVAQGDDIVVQASVPGVKSADLQVSVEDGVLSIRGETKVEFEEKVSEYLMHERRAGMFGRSLRLPEAVDPDKATSTYEDGVLTIRFPKQETKKAKRLTITPGASAQRIEDVKS